MSKIIKLDEDVCRGMENGLNLLADTVKMTLDPRGRNIALDRKQGTPTITKDGVSVAKEINLGDPSKHIDVELVKEVVKKADGVTGDGITTTTVLVQTLVHEGLRNVIAGSSPIALKHGIDQAVEAIVKQLHVDTKPVGTTEQTVAMASISVNGPAIGKFIVRVLERVDAEGTATVEETNFFDTTLETTEDMRFDKGYLSAHFVTGQEHQETVLEDVYTLLMDSKISNVKDIIPTLERVMQTGRPLAIIAKNVGSEALATLVVNKIHGTFKSMAVKAPGFSERCKMMLQGMTILTGGQVISEVIGLLLENADPELLSRARKIAVSKDETTIVEGAGDKDMLDVRVHQARQGIEDTDSDYGREELQGRLAKLVGDVVVIEPGAATEAEPKECKYRIKDAVRSARTASEESLAADGGVAPTQAAAVALSRLDVLTGDEVTGVNIARLAISAPLKQVVKNTGVEGGMAADHVANIRPGHGLSVTTGEYTDLTAASISDPVKVIRSALQSAASIAGMFLTAKAVVADEPEAPIAGGNNTGTGMGGMC